jgi:acylphosphatase
VGATADPIGSSLSIAATPIPFVPSLCGSESPSVKQVQCVVLGRVQGVFFRASAQREAKRLGLTGWVRNRPDGSVELLAEGEDESLRDFIGWVQRGPTSARVDRVDTRWRSYTGEFTEFRIVE